MTAEPVETFLQRALRIKRARQAAERGEDFLSVPMGEALPPDDPDYAARAAHYCTRALAGICEEIAATPEGNRNQVLNDGALRAFRWSLGGHLNREDASHSLQGAGLECGLDAVEVGRTLQSAWFGAAKYGPAHPEVRERATSSPEEVAEEVQQEVTAAGGARALFPQLDWHALWADESEEEWIVEPLLPARRLIALYSAPKLGKSLLMLEIAVAVACGRSVLGVQVERARSVLYIDFENDPKADIRQRLQDMGYGPDDLTELHYLSFPTMAALDGERGGVELMAAVTAYGAEVVVVDTVSRAIQGEENENDTWLSFYRHTGLKLKAAGVALVRLDHSGKDEAKGQRGGSAKSGDVDAVWRLSRVEGETYRLDCEAARMPVTEKVVVLHREEFPLRHRVDARGRLGAWQAKVSALVAAMDLLDLDLEVSKVKAGEALRRSGRKVSNDVLLEAIQERRKRSGNGPDRRSWEDGPD